MKKLDDKAIAVIKKLDAFLTGEEISYVIIGAIVPALLIDMREQDNPVFGSRETKDIDYEIESSTWQEYEAIKAGLREIGFESRPNTPEHSLFCDDIRVDLLPYSDHLVDDNTLSWPTTGSKMNVECFTEAFSHYEQFEIDDELTVPVVTLPVFVALKVFSYLDRKFARDLIDIVYVLEHYEETGDRRFTTSVERGLSFETAGAYLVGLDLKAVINLGSAGRIAEFISSINDPYEELITLILREEKGYLHDDEGEGRRIELLSLFRAFSAAMI